MITASDLLSMSRTELRAILRDGHAIDAAALDGYTYNGVSLGLPRLVERLTWKKFGKTFHRDPDTGVLRGWNVRMQQTPLSEPWRPKLRAGDTPVTFGHYHVIAASGDQPYEAGLTIDYSCGGRTHSPMGRLRDPIVAVNPQSSELLLGWTYVDLGRRRLGTPSFFSLQRGDRLRYVPN